WVSSKGVSDVSVVRHMKELREFKYSRTAEIFSFMQTRLNLETSVFSALAIASNSRFSSYVHLNVILSVNFSDMPSTSHSLITQFNPDIHPVIWSKIFS